MDNKENNNSAVTQGPSMEQILQTIRGVITEEESPLELTEELAADPAASNKTAIDGNFDVLNTIDNAMPTGAPSQSVDDGFGFSVEDIIPKKENAEVKEVAKENPVSIIDNFDKLIPNNIVPDKQKAVEDDVSQNSIIDDFEANDKPKSRLLISEKSAEDASNTIKSFMKSVSKPASDGLGYKAHTTVEELITEMIKPYLKDWLDKNLPTIVKQIVEKEIHKLIPKEDD
jgi:cell pole-organizing protein PopZ